MAQRRWDWSENHSPGVVLSQSRLKKSLCVKTIDFMDKHLRKTQHFCGYSLESKNISQGLWVQDPHAHRD